MGKKKQTGQKQLDCASILHNWNGLNDTLMDLDEREVGLLLSHEVKHNNRITFTMRLHSRLNKLRRERERRALASTGPGRQPAGRRAGKGAR